MKLLNQQKEAVNKLRKKTVGAFFMDAGTGKTRPVVELTQEQNPDYVLYIAPYRTIKTEKHEESVPYQVNLWGGFNCSHDFIGVESVGLSDRVYLEITRKLQRAKYPIMIVDESLKIKNADAKRTERIIELGKYAKSKYILNGTPLSRDLLDLWSQFEFLSPKILKMDLTEFKNTFCEYKKMTITKGNRQRTKEWIVEYHNLEYLYALIEPYVYECELKIDVGLRFINVDYSISENEKAEHKAILEKVLNDKWLMSQPNFFLGLTQRLQNNYSRSEVKFKLVAEILKKHPKTLIVAKFIETQEELKKRFPNSRVLSWQKNAFGLNLQYDYNKMILFDQHWDYGLFDQIIKRIYRTNQIQDCFVWRFIGDVGLEKIMYDNVNNKEDLLKTFKKLSLEQFKKKVI